MVGHRPSDGVTIKILGPCDVSRLGVSKGMLPVKTSAYLFPMAILSTLYHNCVNGTGAGNSEGVAHGRRAVRCVQSPTVIKRTHQTNDIRFRIGTLNIGTMRGRSSEIAEMLSRRAVDLCCVQEHRWRGASARMIDGKDSRYKFFWCGNTDGFGGCGVLLKEKWADKVIDVNRVNPRIIVLKVIVDATVVTVVCVYAPQCGLSDSVKDKFYDELLSTVSKFGATEQVFIAGDLNGHVGASASGYVGPHGGYGYGVRNPEGERILEFCEATDMLVGNTLFTKRPDRLVTYESGGCKSQIDYILVKRDARKSLKDVKVIAGEECIPQHRLVVCDLALKVRREHKKPLVPRRKVWKLKDENVKQAFEAHVEESLSNMEVGSTIEEKWSSLKACLLSATDSTCGWTKGPPRRKETWWWNDQVDLAVKERKRLYKAWKCGGSKEPYLVAKRKVRSEIYAAKKLAEEQKFANILCRDDEKLAIFKVAKQMTKQNQDIVGEKCIRNDDGSLALSDGSKRQAWKSHYERLLNEEFLWDKESLSQAAPVQGPARIVTKDMVRWAMSKMKKGKAAGLTGVVIEMLEASGGTSIDVVTDLINQIISEGQMPGDWQVSSIVNCFKGKGDALERGNYRGLKLLEQVMKILERIVDKLIREQVHINDMQFGFMKGRGTTDAIFIARQLQEKYIAKKKKLYFAFVDLEKAFDRVPRDVVWWAMRKLGVEEWLVKVVQSMYHNVRSRVRVNGEFSDEFEVKVGVHQGSVLSPLLFIMVLEALSQEFRTGCPWELLYADDLVIVAESLDELTERLKLWKENMESKGLRVNMPKTKCLVSDGSTKSTRETGKYPCSICHRGVGRNSVFCVGCKHWVHKKCSKIKGRLRESPDFRCGKCRGEFDEPSQERLEQVLINGTPLEVVEMFCYLGDMFSSYGGVEEAVVARVRSGWKKFRELLPVLTTRGFSLRSKGRMYQACVRSVMLYASETWALREEDLVRLERNDMRMIRWMCGVTLRDRKSSEELRQRLGVESIRECIRKGRLRWFGHIERREDSSWIKRCRDLVVDGPVSRGRPRKTWTQVVHEDLKQLGLDPALAQDRLEWKKAIVNPRPTHASVEKRR